jgi:calcineurin-like phosphoesterase
MIDVHGEATSEKNATGILYDGRVSMVVGTHTHIPTADHRILPKGTAYMTDVGMCGDYTSVIGMNAEAAIGRFIGVDNGKLSVAMGEPSLSGIIVDTNDDTGLATDITPFRRGGTLSQT